MSGTKRQRNKKNKTRPKAGEIGDVSSIQRNYNRKVTVEQNNAQTKLF